ncbi:MULTISPECIES: YraN family protein [unclassified Hahella]|uniref:YraN family protein n=1 Tax=unclassified Hahella TaxID=2624107 RepID=UPI001C1EE43F|nr:MULTISPECIES: YraN family protein [unclassified Hahella]MBU6951798.1 YraN family protein [Hahella sp. HN01]MDG9670684.1 YraN family protein [Hahella sp. CR1]
MPFKRLIKSIDIGRAAESQAESFARAQGFTILERNFRCKGGEIDLIAKHGEHLVFIEVRHRSSDKFGSAAESITQKKQQRIILAANIYLQKKGLTDMPCRFDVIVGNLKSNTGFQWIPDAFSCW